MKGYELMAALQNHFALRGTAGQPVFVRDVKSGTVFSIKGVALENHGEEATLPFTHWIEVEEY